MVLYGTPVIPVRNFKAKLEPVIEAKSLQRIKGALFRSSSNTVMTRLCMLDNIHPTGKNCLSWAGRLLT